MTQQTTTDRATLLRAAIADIEPRHAALPRIGAWLTKARDQLKLLEPTRLR